MEAEDRRVSAVRAIANATQWTGVTQYRPFRIPGDDGDYTLVLPARDASYTFDDLLEYLPRSLVRQPDGSYLLSDDVVVDQGATLSIRSRDGLVLRLASDDSGFTSIVTIGGSLEVIGETEHPVVVSSWDTVRGAADTDTTDGRAYVRVMGGRAAFAAAEFSDLGFWSGMTGGVSLTGMDTLTAIDIADASATSESGNPEVYGTELLPVGEESETTDLATAGNDLDGYGYVSASVIDTSFTANAFGLFVTGAQGVEIRDSRAVDNLVDGIVFHRYVTNSTIRSTTSSGNGQDGIALRRATTGIVLDRLTVTDNARNGVLMNGSKLADGPSATGMSTGVYGNNELTDSTLSGNGRYGVEILGGEKTSIEGNTISDSEMGIVASNAAAEVIVDGNTLEGIARQGIALRDGVTASEVTRNEITGGEHGIYLRDTVADVNRNTITEATRHGITLIGDVHGTVITDNIVSGRGLSAIDTARAEGATVESQRRRGLGAHQAVGCGAAQHLPAPDRHVVGARAHRAHHGADRPPPSSQARAGEPVREPGPAVDLHPRRGVARRDRHPGTRSAGRA